MGRGYFLVRGDLTTCGGRIIEGADDHTIMGIPQARDMDRVTCGRYPGMFIIVGGVPQTDIHGRLMAGTLDSKSSCPCQSRFIASMMDDVYEADMKDGIREVKQPKPLTEEDFSQGKVYGRKIIVLDYENEKPVQGLKVKVKTNSGEYNYFSDDNGRVNTFITENEDEAFMVDIYSLFH